MKHAIISLAIALCVAVFGPHSVSDAGRLITRVGIWTLQLGLLLDGPVAPKDDDDDDEVAPELQDVHAAFGSRPA